MDNFEDVFEKLTDYDLLAIIKAGAENFYGLAEGEALRRMRKSQLEGRLEENRPPAEAPAPAIKRRRSMSAAAKKHISAAQKKRWLKWRKENP